MPFRRACALLACASVLLVISPAAQAEVGLEALTVLPPGNSMRYTAAGQAAGTLSGDPADFGPNVDDQRGLYWSYRFKDGGFSAECDDPEVVRPGSRYCLDEFGVPAIYGDTDADVWYAAGYAVAQLRLFLMDAIRRTARGTLAELTGPGGVPADVQTRVLGYTDAEYDAMFDGLSSASKTAIDSYVEGVNDYIADLSGPRLDELPAEYALLQAAPLPLDRRDVLAMGVLMTREVASEGGTEMANVAALRALEDTFGVEEGRAIFQDLVWVEDAEATVTVPREEGVFPRTDATPGERRAAFEAMADYARTIPLELATGPGTGDAPPPAPALPLRSDADPAARARAALDEWRTAISGGSYLVAIAPERTADGSALLVSQPQLGYNPTLLVELEVHGGGYLARGVSVPGLPVVGIGYTDRVSWALTTGNAKTIDSFIEETRRTADGGLEYRHDGAWRPADCRDEDVRYRAAPEGVPVGPHLLTETVEVCRTIHGPVVAETADSSAARSVEYHMWMREVDTIEGVLAWNRARNFDDFEAAMRKVTWNENTGYADADGRIAFWHPGLHRTRPTGTDLRLPSPGTGEFDLGDHLPFDALPHAIDPDQGYLANWNNKPAHGWLDGVGMSYTSYPAGRGQRVTNLIDALDARDDWTFDALAELDRLAAERDMRATEFLPLLLSLAGRTDLDATERAALEILGGWGGSANGPGADMRHQEGQTATVGAAPTIFEAVLDALVEDLLGPVALPEADLVARQLRSGSHVYEMSPALNLVLRILDPSASSLEPSRDYLRGRDAEEVLVTALRAALQELGVTGPADVAELRREYQMMPVCSPTGGVIGPCTQMPFLERGTWIHLTGFRGAGTPPPASPPPADPPPPATRAALPATGSTLAGLGVALLAAALLGRRRR